MAVITPLFFVNGTYLSCVTSAEGCSTLPAIYQSWVGGLLWLAQPAMALAIFLGLLLSAVELIEKRASK